MESWQIQALGIVVSILGAGIPVYVALRTGLIEVKGDINTKSEKLQAQLDAAVLQIGKLEQWSKDKERFDHEFRHDEYGKAITTINFTLWPLGKQVEIMERSVEDLREWKHMVVDAYLPRAVDEHERRINRLDQKVFNGGSRHP
jgi:hypothetical protein